MMWFRFFTKPKIEIYTDGSTKEGRGAWAFVIVHNGQWQRECSGVVRKAASNPMEFRAAIEAMRSLTERTTATLYSDSRILIDTMTVWKNTGTRPRGLELETAELERLAKKHIITWKWIRAHAGHEFNERCDLLCIKARESI